MDTPIHYLYVYKYVWWKLKKKLRWWWHWQKLITLVILLEKVKCVYYKSIIWTNNSIEPPE